MSSEEIRKFVQAEFKKPSSNYGYGVFIHHIVPMVKIAKDLADELGADKEVVELAAWLHDIGSAMEGREDHHLTGAKIAEEKPKEFNYPEEKIELIKKCILNHRGSLDRPRETVEEKIIAEADAMSNFEMIPGLFEAALVHEGMEQGEAGKEVLAKLERKYKQLHLEESKKKVRPKLEAVRLILGDSLMK